MDKLYAPWRDSYVKNDARSDNEGQSADECVFCKQFGADDDEKYFILRRFTHTAIVLNLYPYNTGHLMVMPFAHQGTLINLDKEVRAELMEATTAAIEVLKEAMQPAAHNVGINLGKASGGGIPAHLHIHIVPRWHGDTNFLPVIFETKGISVDLKKTYAQLKEFTDKIEL